MNPRFVWTPALDARLEELHATGMKFKLIAITLNQEFKTSLTRNACDRPRPPHLLPLRTAGTSSAPDRSDRPNVNAAPSPPIAPAGADPWRAADAAPHQVHLPLA